MTANEALSLTAELRPHPFPETVLLRWLKELDGTFYDALFSRHTAGEGPVPFDPAAEADRPLLVPPPYDGIYTDWLTLRVDTALGETARANNGAALFERDRAALAAHLSRSFAPAGTVIDIGLGGVPGEGARP